MSINTMEYAAVFMQELDSQMVECATSGWMENNAGQVQYSGGAEVKIPKMELSGLGNYDRDKGFATGSVTVNYETKRPCFSGRRHGCGRNKLCGSGRQCHGGIPENKGHSRN